MTLELTIEIATTIAAISLIISVVAVVRSRRNVGAGMPMPTQLSELVRAETDRIRQFTEDHARVSRKELADQIQVFQTKLDQDISRMGVEANQNREALRANIEIKLDTAAAKQEIAAKNLREEMTGSFDRLGNRVSETLTQTGQQQKERLEGVTLALAGLTEKHERAQEALKQTVEARLEIIRVENSAKLDEMRKTVDEKLQATLETRLGESFNRVVEHLERVHKGIGEMQQLAAGVGDLKKLFSNVKARGTFGEVQLSVLIEQFLTPDQYMENVQIKEGSQERVEFAIRMPGRNSGGEVLLPVDAKFPHEDFERLVVAAESGDSDGVAEAAKALENRVKACAKTIREKYIDTPRTTDFGILFLPTESLYAEVLRRPGLLEQIQRDHHVTLAGPTTFAAILNALHMGFRSLAIEKRSSEVWQILGAVQNEFGKYNKVVETLSRQLDSAATSVKNLGVRTRVMNRKLIDVQKLPDETAQLLLGTEFKKGAEVEEEEGIDSHTPDDLNL